MITKEDVERLPAARAPAAAPEPLSRVQQAVARHMAEAAAVPTFAVEVEIDMTACSELRQSLDPRPSFNDLVVKACAVALREHPRVNAAYSEQGFRYATRDQRRHRGRGRGRAARPGRPRRGREVARGDPRRDARARGEGAGGNAHAGRARRRDLHGLEPRHARRPALRGAAEHAAGGDPRRRRRRAPAGRRRRTASSVVRPLMSATLVCDHRILYGADGAVVPRRACASCSRTRPRSRRAPRPCAADVNTRVNAFGRG